MSPGLETLDDTHVQYVVCFTPMSPTLGNLDDVHLDWNLCIPPRHTSWAVYALPPCHLMRSGHVCSPPLLVVDPEVTSNITSGALLKVSPAIKAGKECKGVHCITLSGPRMSH